MIPALVWHVALTRDLTPGAPATSLCGRKRKVRVRRQRYGIMCGPCLRATLANANTRRATFTYSLSVGGES